jgi:hypothetical protein
LLGLASLILAAVVWLAFHDVSEAHTVRDWMTLLAAVLVWSSTALSFRRLRAEHRRVAGAAGV